MNRSINDLLTAIRGKLEEGAEASGPSGTKPGKHATGGSAGSFQADNVIDTEDALEAYVVEILSNLLDLYELDEDDAMEFIFDVADALVDEDLLPPFPEDDDSDKAKAAWLGTAKTIGFGAIVMQTAEDESVD